MTFGQDLVAQLIWLQGRDKENDSFYISNIQTRSLELRNMCKMTRLNYDAIQKSDFQKCFKMAYMPSLLNKAYVNPDHGAKLEGIRP